VHGCEGCEPALRYLAKKILSAGPGDLVAAGRDRGYLVCTEVSRRKELGNKNVYRLVAINTLMFPRGSNPSSWLMSSNIVRWTSLSPPAPSSKRAPPMASTSSKKMMHAFLLRAISNSSRIIRAPSPTYFWTSSEPMTRINVASVRLATARAQSVFPVPGGPKSRTPFGGSMPRLTNRSG
jgi:hypothetical protein